MDEILDLFREEANEHLAALERGFLDLEKEGSADACGPLIDRLFRHAHGLKGAARAVELFDIQDCAQKLEDALDELRGEPAAVTPETIGQGLAQFDALRDAFQPWQGPISDRHLPIEAESEIGNRKSEIYSTVFRISVPVTISTVRILTVSCGGQHYGIPSSSIVRTARVQPDELRELEGSLILTADGQLHKCGWWASRATI